MKRWPTKSLGELAGGGQYGLNVAAMSEGTGVRFVRITDITHAGELRHEAPAFVPDNTPELNSYELKDGDVLIARSGATAGKSYIHHSFGERAVFAGYLIRFQPDTTKILPRFIGAFLQTPNYWRQLNSHKRAVAQPNVNAKQLASLVLPVPPLPEQGRIVKLLAEADELRKLRTKADRRATDLIPALFHEMFGDPVTNTRNWKRQPFADLLHGIDSGWSPVCHDRPAQPDEWGVLKLGAVTTCRYLDTETKALPENFAPRPELEVNVGDLLFTRKNTYELVAACAFVFQTRPKLTLSDLLFRFRLRPDAGVDPIFLWGLLTVPSKRKQVQTLAGGSAGSMPNISKARLMTLAIELPPLTLQSEFAQRVTEIRALEAGQATSRTHLDTLFQSMLHRAFNGQL